jgi:hypothetical protein
LCAATYATLPIHTFPTYAQYGIQLIILCCTSILSFKKRHNDDVVAVAGVVVCTNLVLACRVGFILYILTVTLQLPYTHMTSSQISIIHISVHVVHDVILVKNPLRLLDRLI